MNDCWPEPHPPVTLPPKVAAEIRRLFNDLTPQLIDLLSGNQKFRIEIHGKPGARCTYSITKLFE